MIQHCFMMLDREGTGQKLSHFPSCSETPFVKVLRKRETQDKKPPGPLNHSNSFHSLQWYICNIELEQYLFILCIYMYVHVWIGQKLMSSIFLECSPLFFLRQGLFLNLGLTDWLDRLTSKPYGSSYFYFPSTKITEMHLAFIQTQEIQIQVLVNV